MNRNERELPVRMHETDEKIVVVAPMPGLEPEDISISVEGNRLSLRGEERGPRQHDREMLVSEWTVGPYIRQIDLPVPVRGPMINATYGNGVLVVSLPKAPPGSQTTSASFSLRPIEATRGEHVGHHGKVPEPS
jgi:HSP20 family protein